MPALRNHESVLNLHTVLTLLTEALAHHMMGNTKPTDMQLRQMAETVSGGLQALEELRATLASLPGRPSEQLYPPYTGRLEADLGMMAGALRDAAQHNEPVDGVVLVGFAVTMENLLWRAAIMERLLGITPEPPKPPGRPFTNSTRKALAAANHGRIAA
ncbi:hypothetical protein [Ferrovibrio sp.]|uniref:hypothetical protein n=1 Tax=Ferrovibrio sp. TaxID=1917215 RepID=UPI0035B10493